MKFPSLTDAQAEKRLREDGKNTVGGGKKKSRLAVFLGQYKDVMTLILLLCTVISFLFGEYAEAVAIALIVLANGLLGYWQEYRTERTLDALNRLSAPQAYLFRNNRPVRIASESVVRGDLLILRAGDRVPADALVIESVDLQADESMLTGESRPVSKQSAPDGPIVNQLGDLRLVFAGTNLTRGHGLARVIDTGKNTQMGKIAHLLEETEKETPPLSKKLDQMGKILALGCTAVCLAVTLCGILRGEAVMDMLLLGISLAVAAVPEGLSAIVTVSLAISVARMKEHHALVRHLHAVETLGCASVICTDKTGTLTENRMSVQSCFTLQNGIRENTLPDAAERALIHGAFLCCKQDFAADPTETALIRHAKTHLPGIRPLLPLAELPFDSERKRMSVLVKENQTTRMYTKGATDYLLPLCSHHPNGTPLTAADQNRITDALQILGKKGLRTICVAYRDTDTLQENNLTFLGLLSMSDPPREGVRQAIAQCKQAGIRVCMITGDHPSTAAAIAEQLQILTPGDAMLTGEQLDTIPQAALTQQITRTTVFARVTPTQKLKIVQAFRSRGLVCAMTGDGVNDAPALKSADIGVSMGKNGTDVAREASDIILLDDNFTTLTEAVRCGRGVYDNIRKFLRYLLSCNIGEVLTMFLGILLNLPVVLLPLQILFVNLVTDGLPAMALSLEPVESSVMQRKPRPLSANVFSNGLGCKILFRGILIGFTTLTAFWLTLYPGNDLTAARSAALFTLVTAQLIHVFECRSESGHLFSVSLLSNKAIPAAVTLSFGMLLTVLYCKPCAMLFGVCPLSGAQLITCLLCAAGAPLLSLLFSGILKQAKSKR